MSNARIPFAIRKSDQCIVEVSDVKRGQECGSVCPECKQGVVAKQGNVNIWHFSHDQNPKDKPDKACDISFYSCCRQYVIELLLKGRISQLCTPEYVISEPCNAGVGKEWTKLVTQAHTFKEITVKTTKYDVEIGIGQHNFQLFIAYPGRVLPHCPDEKKTGILVVDITIIKTDYYAQKTSPGLLKILLNRLFANENRHKHWLFHPREESVRSKLQEEARTDPRCHASDTHIHSAKDKVTHSPRQDEINSPVLHGQYHCPKCDITWHGRKDVDSYCPKCHEYLYSRFYSE